MLMILKEVPGYRPKPADERLREATDFMCRLKNKILDNLLDKLVAIAAHYRGCRLLQSFLRCLGQVVYTLIILSNSFASLFNSLHFVFAFVF